MFCLSICFSSGMVAVWDMGKGFSWALASMDWEISAIRDAARITAISDT